MFVIERYSETMRPGRAEDGPPYGPPGMWWHASTTTHYATHAEAQVALDRMLAPWPSTPMIDPERYRITDLRLKAPGQNIRPRKTRVPVSA
jgi:hypothetical protein